MNNILISFLKTLHMKHTSAYAEKLYEEYPHKYNLYGLSKMLEEYGITNAGVRINDKNIRSLEVPFIAHIGNDFVVVDQVTDKQVYYHWKDKDIKVSIEQFQNLWSGVVLIAEPDETSIEPEYKQHRKQYLLNVCQNFLLVSILFIALLWTYGKQGFHVFSAVLFLLYAVGALTCLMLLQKQIYVHGQYADKICSLFKQKDCNNVLESDAAKLFGWISWSEIGLGYFLSNLLLMAGCPALMPYLTIINILVLPYTIWSVWYQYRIVKQWCMLCMVVQSILWLAVLIAFIGELIHLPDFNVVDICKVGMIYIFLTLLINKVSSWLATQKKKAHIVQELNSLKTTEEVFKALLEKQPYHPIDITDSGILFGNPKASLRVSILTNPHCEPCARMHTRVEKLLQKVGDKLCIQYIFSAFDDNLLKSNRFLIAVYQNESRERTEEIYHRWYDKEKYHVDTFIQSLGYDITSESVTKELKRHNEWKETNKLSATPTILVNGYLLPEHYQIEDLAEFVDSAIYN